MLAFEVLLARIVDVACGGRPRHIGGNCATLSFVETVSFEVGLSFEHFSVLLRKSQSLASFAHDSRCRSSKGLLVLCEVYFAYSVVLN